ncbi:helix-turn-helix transcriptional regulator [Piscinibacter sp.]|uniref:helix-turn-helix transcriptional regulator n=1 Tax=Piscinibacter sp. TaxID=1903157 RepID=UPI002ED6A93E
MTPSPHDLVAQPGYFQRAGEAICQIACALTEADVIELFSQAVRCIGADMALFCSLVSDRPTELQAMLACDPRWALAYEQSSLPQRDPWIAYARERCEPVCASRIENAAPSHVEALALAKRYGFESILVVPSPSTSSSAPTSVLVLGSSKAAFFELNKHAAMPAMSRWLSMELQQWWLNQSKRELMQRAQLTSTDLDLLRHERKGCGTKEISRQLRMTKQSIDSRFQRLNARLGVPNRKAAASLAAAYGLI